MPHDERDLGGEPDAGVVVVSFSCSLCDKPATTIQLELDGGVVVEGLVCRTSQRVAPENEPRLRAILAARDARGLRDFDPEWGAFYCPECARSYCADHWHFDVRYDDDFPGWYDCTYGTCPVGHRHLVDD